MRRNAALLAVTVPTLLLTMAGSATAETAHYCDLGFSNPGPVLAAELPHRYRHAATQADLDGDGWVCGQRYMSSHVTYRVVGIHWEDDQDTPTLT